jgi:hypothetical protein
MADAESEWSRWRKLALAGLLNELWVLPPAESILGRSIAQAFHPSGLEPPRVVLQVDAHGRLADAEHVGRLLGARASVSSTRSSPSASLAKASPRIRAPQQDPDKSASRF